MFTLNTLDGQRRWLATLAIVHVLGMANWRWGPIRSTWPTVNYGFMLIVFLAPLIFAALVLIFNRMDSLVAVVLVFLLPWGLFCGLCAVFATSGLGSTLARGEDPFQTRLHSTPMGHYRVSVYRTDGGAMTKFGISVKQEWVLFPGLMLAKRISGVYPGDTAQVEILGPNEVRVFAPPYKPGRPMPYELTVRMKPYVAF